MACEGKVGLVTGSAEGIGKAIADALLSQGAKVCVCDLNAKLGEETVKSFGEKYGKDRVIFSKCDITKEKELEATFQDVTHKLGGLHVVVNNAGIADEIKWRKTIDVNMIGTIRSTQLAVEAMRSDKGGQGGIIVNIASTEGIKVTPNLPVYSATKHAVIGFTRGCADNHHYQQVGLSFACICPNATATAMGGKARLLFPFEGKGMEFTVMSPNKVGEALLQLLGESSPNGAVVIACGERGIRITYPKSDEAVALD